MDSKATHVIIIEVELRGRSLYLPTWCDPSGAFG